MQFDQEKKSARCSKKRRVNESSLRDRSFSFRLGQIFHNFTSLSIIEINAIRRSKLLWSRIDSIKHVSISTKNLWRMERMCSI